MFKCDILWLSVDYDKCDSCWIKPPPRLQNSRVCTGKWDCFISFFLQSLSQMPHIHKLILWELTHDSSEAFCIWLPSTIVPLFIHWISASYIQLLSIGLFVFCKQLVCLLFHSIPLLIMTKLSTLPWLFISRLFCEVPPPPLRRRPPSHFSACICGSKISNFIFFVVSLQNVEVFYWCGEKQWAQGRALWWQKCIFNPCEWMAPHIPQQQALYWMAALTRLFSLLITALCLFTMDIVIYLHQVRGGSPLYTLCHRRFLKEISLSWIRGRSLFFPFITD